MKWTTFTSRFTSKSRYFGTTFTSKSRYFGTTFTSKSGVFDLQKWCFPPQKWCFWPPKVVFSTPKVMFLTQKWCFWPQSDVFDPKVVFFDPKVVISPPPQKCDFPTPPSRNRGCGTATFGVRRVTFTNFLVKYGKTSAESGRFWSLLVKKTEKWCDSAEVFWLFTKSGHFRTFTKSDHFRTFL